MGKLYTGYDYSVSPDQQAYSGEIEGVDTINEITAKATGDFVEIGCGLMKEFLEA